MKERKLFSLMLKPEDYPSQGALMIVITLSQIKELYADQEAVHQLLAAEDPQVYHERIASFRRIYRAI